jgi:hypothetical protein
MEAEIRRITGQGQLRQKSEVPYQLKKKQLGKVACACHPTKQEA